MFAPVPIHHGNIIGVRSEPGEAAMGTDGAAKGGEARHAVLRDAVFAQDTIHAQPRPPFEGRFKYSGQLLQTYARKCCAGFSTRVRTVLRWT